MTLFGATSATRNHEVTRLTARLLSVAALVACLAGTMARAVAAAERPDTPARQEEVPPHPVEMMFRLSGVPVFATEGIKSSWHPSLPRFAIGSSFQERWGKGIHIVSLDRGLDETGLCGTPWARHPAWSPDGKWIAFVESGEDGGIIRLVDAETGRSTLDVARGDFPFWALGSERLFFHDRKLDAVASVAVADVRAGGPLPERRLEASLPCWHPGGSGEAGLVAWYDRGWLRVLRLGDLIEWPVGQATCSGDSRSWGESAGAAFAAEGRLVVFGSDGTPSRLLALSPWHPQEVFQVYANCARPAVSSCGRWIAFDSASGSVPDWTRIVPLRDVWTDRERVLRSAIMADPGTVPTGLAEVAGFLRFRYRAADLCSGLIDLMGKDRAADPRVRTLGTILRAYEFVQTGRSSAEANADGDPMGPLRTIVDSVKEDAGGANSLRLWAREVLAEALVAEGSYAEAAREFAALARQSPARGAWLRTLRVAELGGDLAIALEAIGALAPKEFPFQRGLMARALALGGEHDKAEALIEAPFPRDAMLTLRVAVLARGDRPSVSGTRPVVWVTPPRPSRSGYWFARAHLLEGRAEEALAALTLDGTLRSDLLFLVILDRVGRHDEALDRAVFKARALCPLDEEGLFVGYLLRCGRKKEARALIDERGVPLGSSSILGAAARLAGSELARPGEPWPETVEGVPDLPTAPARALELARRGIRPDPDLLRKALAFARRMELTWSPELGTLESPYRVGSLVALEYLAGRCAEAARRLDLAIRSEADPVALWLDPDVIALGDPPELRKVFALHGVGRDQ